MDIGWIKMVRCEKLLSNLSPAPVSHLHFEMKMIINCKHLGLVNQLSTVAMTLAMELHWPVSFSVMSLRHGDVHVEAGL